jgi:hypothetical protein
LNSSDKERRVFKEKHVLLNMNDEIKDALSQVLEALQKDDNLYKVIPEMGIENKENLTAQGIVNMSVNHVFDNHLNLFGISRMEAIKIQSYFSRYASMNQFYINELYKEFPGIFKGESRDYIDNLRHLDKSIPIF